MKCFIYELSVAGIEINLLAAFQVKNGVHFETFSVENISNISGTRFRAPCEIQLKAMYMRRTWWFAVRCDDAKCLRARLMLTVSLIQLYIPHYTTVGRIKPLRLFYGVNGDRGCSMFFKKSTEQGMQTKNPNI